MKREIVKTEDGSHTIQVKEMNEHYHSIHGALQESAHVFVKHGFHNAGKWLNPLNILEVGFGTGLNALLTYKEHLEEKRKINYIGVEPFPLTDQEVNALNYHEIVDMEDTEKVFKALHKKSDSPYFIGDRFIMLHLKEKIEEISLKPESFNLIYFDAFAPSVQEELWTREIFEKLYAALEGQGVLVTYSASGNVKRALSDAGFMLEHPEGPKGKREITVAFKKRSWQQIMEE